MTRAVNFEGAGPANIRGRVEYDFHGPVLPPAMQAHDFALLAVLFLGMAKARPIHVQGRVSRRLLAQLEEFQFAWTRWRPGTYSRVPITANEITEAPTNAAGGAVLAFSGGLDAGFTLLRHSTPEAGPQCQKLVTGVFIGGLDIPGHRPDLVRAAAADARRTLESFGLPLTVIETNWKESACTDWAMEYFVGLAACLHCFAGVASVGLVGNCVDYGSMQWPLGSNPITNNLLDSDDFRMVTDGAGYTRCEKALRVAREPRLLKYLRVCWWGPQSGSTGANCGRCEKCVRTKLNIRCHGLDPGPALPPNHSLLDVMLIGIRFPPPPGEIGEILSIARSNGLRAPWVAALHIGLVVSLIAGAARWLYHPLKARFRQPRPQEARTPDRGWIRRVSPGAAER